MAGRSNNVLLSWSSGKDSAWALHVMRGQPDLDVVGLVTTFNEAFDRVAMHAVRRELVAAQAAAAGLPLVPVMPAGVDHCGERGEFHTFCYRCPEFGSEIGVTVGDIVEREAFWFADLGPGVVDAVNLIERSSPTR